VQKTLNSIQEIETPHFKKSWSQEIEYLTNLQTEFAKCETYETVNTHYRELNRITKKAKNIVVYIDASQTRKKGTGFETETEIETTVVFTHDSVRCSKATNVFSKIIITEAKLQAISDAIAIFSEKVLKNSEIWLYTDSQMTLQRLNLKSNANSMLFNDIRQNLIDLRQKQCQIHIHWILSCKDIIENEKADELAKIAAKELSAVSNMKITIINFVKKQISKETESQWLNTWNISIKKGNQYWKHVSEVNFSHKSLKELQKIDRLIFSTFIQLKMRHDYFKSYLHWLSQNNSNKRYSYPALSSFFA
jgi:ribonuclease HI